jgi:acyl-CoA dehydrogenase
VRVPVGNRIGEEGEGFKLGQKWLGIGRVKHGARALGVAERSLELATSYAKIRATFGRQLADRQAIQWKLADIYIELQAARLLVYHTAAKLDKGEDARTEAYVCKYFADEMAFRAIDACLQIHGGIGLTTELPIEKLWRQQRSYRITEGPSEVMKMVIARHVLKNYG